MPPGARTHHDSRVVKSLYRQHLRVAYKLDDPKQHRALQALFMGSPRRVWVPFERKAVSVRGRRTNYLRAVAQYNDGDLFKPKGQSVAEHMKREWRTKGWTLDEGFRLLRYLKEVLELSQHLPDDTADSEATPPSADGAERQAEWRGQLRISKQSLKKVQLMVGHPFGHLLEPLVHRSVVVLDPVPFTVDGEEVMRGFILNKPSGRILRETVHSQQHEVFGPLLDYPVFLGGKEEYGFLLIHPWPDVPGCQKIRNQNLYLTDLQASLSSGWHGPIEHIKKKLQAGKIEPLVRLLWGHCLWHPKALEAELHANFFIPLEGKKPSAPMLRQVLKTGRSSDSDPSELWKGTLCRAGGDAKLLTSIPELSSEFGDKIKPLCETYLENVRILTDQALERERRRREAARNDAGKPNPGAAGGGGSPGGSVAGGGRSMKLARSRPAGGKRDPRSGSLDPSISKIRKGDLSGRSQKNCTA